MKKISVSILSFIDENIWFLIFTMSLVVSQLIIEWVKAPNNKLITTFLVVAILVISIFCIRIMKKIFIQEIESNSNNSH